MPKFFWYERSALAKWCPNISDEAPGKRVGPQPKTSQVHTLKPDEEALPLRALAMIYPPPEDVPPKVSGDPTLDQIADAVSEKLRDKLSQP
mgnify:CR=1 FL=1